MLYGAIIGDIVGSKYEFNNIKTKEFTFFEKDMFFTDDTVMSVAITEALFNTYKNDYKNLSAEVIKQMQKYGRMYSNVGYGGMFRKWLKSENPEPYNSCGNGSAMRVSSVAYFAKSIDEVKMLAKMVTEVTHNHEEGIKGSEATAVAIYMALNKSSKEEIKKYIVNNYYDLNYDYEKLKKEYTFKALCQTTVPEALYCFLISNSFEDTIRTGISIGGDSDTLCAIAGAVAEAYYGVDENMKEISLTYLDQHLCNKIIEFNNSQNKPNKEDKDNC